VIAANLPEGVVAGVSGGASTVGDALVGHPLVRTVSFTGSTASGRRIAAAAAGGVKKCVLELGGNDAAIFLADAPLDERTLERLTWGFCLASGQICMAIRRLYVERPLHDDLVEALSARLERLVIGDGLEPESDLGPLQNRDQAEQHDAFLKRTVAEGGVVLERGLFANEALTGMGYFRRPALVTQIDDTAEIVAEEQFSPVLPILPFDTVEEGILRANNSEYGLSSSVWSGDEERAREVATQLQSGLTFINNHNLDALDRRLPYGGVKQSGIGREGAAIGALEYLDYHGITNYDRVAAQETVGR
jgi:acyl-CoA reductase-like NAD-dependent aldehyde dehydrogenase